MSVITIDGPAGAGKSTVARILAKRLGYQYLDTGAMYRAVALAVKRAKIAPEEEERVEGLLKGIRIDLHGDSVFLNGEDVSNLIRDPEIDLLASRVSRIRPVREFLTGLQRAFSQGKAIVAEGRDMGTVVFPDAPYKFFLTASPEERARRRKRQLEMQGKDVSYEAILLQIRERDEADSKRAIAPLQMAPDATLVDTTQLEIEDVIEKILRVII